MGSHAIFGVRMEAQSARVNPTRNRVRNPVAKGKPHGKPKWLGLVKSGQTMTSLFMFVTGFAWHHTSVPGPKHLQSLGSQHPVFALLVHGTVFKGKVQNCGLPKVEERMQNSEIQ